MSVKILEALVETLNTTGRIDNFIVAREVRMASVADISADGRNGSPSLEGVATSTSDRAVNVIWVDVFLHDSGFS